MAPAIVAGKGEMPEFEGRTIYVAVICVIIAAFGGLMFGYDIGISDGVTVMDDFLKKFFPRPTVYERKQYGHENNYCKYDNQYLQLFTSSLYLAALVASFIASMVCSKTGRKPTMQIASLFFLLGVFLTAGGTNIEMVIIGRILHGCGVGFGNQAVPLFLSELAPTKIRGALNICFQLFITIGILIANLVNYWASNIHPNGWRFLWALQEFDSIVNACEMARQVKQPFKKLMEPASRPPLVIAIMLQVFQQFTGINAIMFYAPVLFQTVGFGSDAALLSAVITGAINVLSTFVSIYLVDKAGRKILLLQACVQMLLTQGIIGGILMKNLKTTDSYLSHGEVMFVVILVCLFVMGLAWSWGSLGWLIPSEIFPLETRTAGFAFAVSSNMLFTFIIAQAFLSMLCHMQAGIFFFFAAWIVVMGLFT
ncbi:Sugar/inositol transporter [Corchorus olitorius]|uniref:Sugar/inositol transporter n=1 Tax=Corchorus olitorius TaxID=93759 RepID=A0A1R3KH20_9ROSI|nr:Sugar/inositol transporter [Corchorus olitorius]